MTRMRLVIVVLAALLVLPASARAGVIALEGTQLVYRGDPGVADKLIFSEGDDALLVNPLGAPLRIGAGCGDSRLGVQCPLAGVAGLTVFAGDGDDDVQAFTRLPVTLDLGDGDDHFDASGTAVTVLGGAGKDQGIVSADRAAIAGGDGNDGFEVEGSDRSSGPYALDGGPGDDVISLQRRGPGMTLTGGDGNDKLYATATGKAPVTFVCGPGADRWEAYPRDVPGDGCAAHLAGITTRTVSRAFREGALTGPASGSVTLKRRRGLSGIEGPTVARGVFTAQPGPLRLSLKRTATGTRLLRRTPHLPVFVTIRTRTGSDRGVTTFRSKVG